MESDIKVKCSIKEMEDLFDNEQSFSVRYYEFIEEGICKCRIRHKELNKGLSGTYTIPQLRAALK